MSAYLRLDQNGYILGYGSSPGGSDWVETDIDIDQINDSAMFRVIDGELVQTEIAAFPAHWYEAWDEVNGGWIDTRDLNGKKAGKWEEIKAARDNEEFGNFEWGGYVFDCDQTSQMRIQGAVQLATIDTAMTIDWTLADNTVQEFTAAEIVQIGEALANHVSECHQYARIKRTEINDATTESELEAISW